MLEIVSFCLNYNEVLFCFACNFIYKRGNIYVGLRKSHNCTIFKIRIIIRNIISVYLLRIFNLKNKKRFFTFSILLLTFKVIKYITLILFLLINFYLMILIYCFYLCKSVKFSFFLIKFLFKTVKNCARLANRGRWGILEQ